MRWNRNRAHLIAPATGGSFLFNGGLSFIVSKISHVLSTYNHTNKMMCHSHKLQNFSIYLYETFTSRFYKDKLAKA